MGEIFILSEGVHLITPDASAHELDATGGGAANQITVRGTIMGGYGIVSNAVGSTIIVETTGTVSGTSQAGIVVPDHGTLRNFGTITGINGVVGTAQVGTFFVYNEGLIRSTTGSALTGSSGNDVIINHGTIDGFVSLGGGDDTYDGRLGFAINHDDPGFPSIVLLDAGNDWAYGGSGTEIFLGGLGNDYINGGGGNDTAYFSGAATVDLRRTGPQNTGEGNDTLVDIENVTAGTGGSTLTGNDKGNVLKSFGGQDVLDGQGGNDTLIGGEGNDLLQGGDGQDTAGYSGLKSNYTWVTNADGSVTVTDQRATGDGVDQLRSIQFLQFSDQIVALTNSAPTNIAISKTVIQEDALASSIVATLSSVDADGDSVSYSLTNDGGGTFRLDGANLVLVKALDYEAQSQQSVTVNAKDAWGGESFQTFTIEIANVVETNPLFKTGTSGSDALTGEAGNDVLRGLGGNDTLRGEAGNDMIFGSSGKDELAGGSGQDIFVFDTKPNKTTNLDRIVDFSVAEDTIQLAKSAFTKITKKGVLASTAFWAGDKAHDASDRVIYNAKNGALFYDQDGNGSHAAIQVASLSKNLKTMTAKDFFVI